VDFILAGNPSGGNLGEKKKGQMKVRDDDIKKRETKKIFIMYKEPSLSPQFRCKFSDLTTLFGSKLIV
jgi:hypothetical protein